MKIKILQNKKKKLIKVQKSKEAFCVSSLPWTRENKIYFNCQNLVLFLRIKYFKKKQSIFKGKKSGSCGAQCCLF